MKPASFREHIHGNLEEIDSRLLSTLESNPCYITLCHRPVQTFLSQWGRCGAQDSFLWRTLSLFMFLHFTTGSCSLVSFSPRRHSLYVVKVGLIVKKKVRDLPHSRKLLRVLCKTGKDLQKIWHLVIFEAESFCHPWLHPENIVCICNHQVGPVAPPHSRKLDIFV